MVQVFYGFYHCIIPLGFIMQLGPIVLFGWSRLSKRLNITKHFNILKLKKQNMIMKPFLNSIFLASIKV